MSGDWQTDAELAGTLYRKAKPYTAMLIARSVEPGEGQTDGLNHVGANAPTTKVSMRDFADLSGIGKDTVGRYLRTWQAMAEAGIVPFPKDLEPGEDVEVPDQKVWTYYYREANPPKPKKEKPKEIDPENPDLDGRVQLDGKHVVTALKMADGIDVDRLPPSVAPHARNLSEALVRLATSDNPNRAYVAACSALSELVASLNS